jgi:hypothetical protein
VSSNMHSPANLHDFVLNLLSDPTALEAFQVDAEGTLARAGLSDISALDVQEVIPLVLDYAPTNGLPAVDAALVRELPMDFAEDGPAGAISQLHAMTQHLSLTAVPNTSDLNLAAAGALTADATGLRAFGGVAGWGLGEGLGAAQVMIPGDFSVVNDVTGTLDGVVNTAGATANGAVATVDVQVDAVSGTAHGLTGSTLPVSDGVTGHAFATVDSLHGLVDSVAGGVTGGLTDGWHVDGTLGASGLGQTGSGDLAFSGENPAGDVLHTTTGIVHDSGVSHVAGVATGVTGVVSDTGVGNVVSNVTGVTEGVHAPAVDHHAADLLF